MVTFQLTFIALLSSTLTAAAVRAARRCTVIPGDPTWPSAQTWDTFNLSVGGRLIKTVPLASSCHGEQFDADKCEEVRGLWHRPEFHEQSSSSIMSAPFSNRSCDPFNAESDHCEIGTYVEYAVNVSTPEHIIRTLGFAKEHNIRFVIRNSGHDYMGKSTGHGGLAVWMHHLTETEWVDSFSGSSKSLSHAYYDGPAVKMGAGVSVLQMYDEASGHGYAIIGGDCPSVGMAGGFIQGGGVGPLSSIRGMLADQALVYEVITTSGRFVNATPTENEDLYWALSGGGPGTYAIIWSTTVKVQPDLPIGSATLSFSESTSQTQTTRATVTLDKWWQGIRAYRQMTLNLTSAGGYALSVYTSGSFNLNPLILPNDTPDLPTVWKILNPFLEDLDEIGMKYTLKTNWFPGFLEAHRTLLPARSSLFDVQNAVMGSRLLRKSLWESPDEMARLEGVVREIVDDDGGEGGGGGVIAYDISVAPSREAGGDPDNAVFPAWREANAELAFLIPWNDTGTFAQYKEQQNKMTNVYMPAFKNVTPGSGAFLNEADAFDPDWKESFYGSNYEKLLRIKDVWDPDQVLYGSTAVGGDRWVLMDDGRLCQVDEFL